MFYRRKIIFALMQVLKDRFKKDRLEESFLQELIFLYDQQLKDMQMKTMYDFVPHNHGPYSYSLNADLEAMSKKSEIMSEVDPNNKNIYYLKKDTSDFLDTLKTKDKEKRKDEEIFEKFIDLFGNQNSEKLSSYINTKYSYYTDKNYENLRKEAKKKSKSDTIILFTIGYEGISPEEYLNKLITHKIKLLIDVRGNAISRKFGFSKPSLEKYCNDLFINYIHIPELGIPSNKRHGLVHGVSSEEDYEHLFERYKITVLKDKIDEQKKVIEYLKEYKRVALTCFEADARFCHRKYLADSLMNISDIKFESENI